jgi:DNA-binding response OmpR family regulator
VSDALSILVVEDAAVARESIAGFLRNHGYIVLETWDGQEALRLIEEAKLDVVISDFRLNGVADGLQVLGRFNEVSPGKGKILTSAFGSDEEALAARRIGAVYMAKPLDLENLLTQIRLLSAAP